jgi:hypothetical protein
MFERKSQKKIEAEYVNSKINETINAYLNKRDESLRKELIAEGMSDEDVTRIIEKTKTQAQVELLKIYKAIRRGDQDAINHAKKAGEENAKTITPSAI